MADYSGWFDQNERKQKRKLFTHTDKQIPMPLYQLTIGLVVLYGLLLNAIFSVLLSERAVLLLYEYMTFVFIGYFYFLEEES